MGSNPTVATDFKLTTGGKMNKNSEDGSTASIFCIVWAASCDIFLMLGLFIGVEIGTIDVQTQAIKNNVAQYNPNTAQFEWKTLIEEEETK